MSRSYRVLAVALVGVLVLVGLAQLVRNDDPTPASAASGQDPATANAAAAPGDTSTGSAAAPSGDTQAVTDEADADVETSTTTLAPPAAGCTVAAAMKVGATGDEVACLQAQLSRAGFTVGSPNGTFDTATDQAVRSFQAAKALEVDGIAGRQTAQALGIWSGPTGPVPATDADCPSTARGAIIDRASQRGALCENGAITYQFPLTTALSQPDPGVYPVYAKDLNASSNFGGHYSTMTHFVAFTRGKYKGARIAFHSVPKLPNGDWVMPLDAVGTKAYHGESSGCIRVLPDDAVKIWDWLSQGDEVHVIS